MKFFYSLVFLLLQTFLFAQSIHIEISGLTEQKGHVFSLSGEKIDYMDSVISSGNSSFTLSADPLRYHFGFYRFICKNNVVDFLFDGKDIDLRTNVKSIVDSMHIINSESNRLYYSFIKLNKAYKAKSELLLLMLAKFPKDDEYYSTTQARLQSLQKEYTDFVEVKSQKERASLAARYIRSARLPVVDGALPPDKQLVYLKTHALDYIDFKDVELTFSGLFSEKIIEYLMYYRNPQLTKEQLGKEFLVAVDSLLTHARKDAYVYQHVTEYLVDGFKKFGFDDVIDYIIENYVIKDDICLDEKLESTLQRRMQQAKRFKIGSTVPNIVLHTPDEKDISLNTISSEKILLVFYATWCPHCREMLPKLAQLYSEQKREKFEVVAVSLDTSSTDWKKFISENSLTWINARDAKGWDGVPASEYCIYATPTMFLINKKLELLAKPSNIEDVVKGLK